MDNTVSIKYEEWRLFTWCDCYCDSNYHNSGTAWDLLSLLQSCHVNTLVIYNRTYFLQWKNTVAIAPLAVLLSMFTGWLGNEFVLPPLPWIHSWNCLPFWEIKFILIFTPYKKLFRAYGWKSMRGCLQRARKVSHCETNSLLKNWMWNLDLESTTQANRGFRN